MTPYNSTVLKNSWVGSPYSFHHFLLLRSTVRFDELDGAPDNFARPIVVIVNVKAVMALRVIHKIDCEVIRQSRLNESVCALI